MKLRYATLSSVAGLGLVTLLALPARAAPVSAADIAAGARESNVENVASYGRRCWRRHGKLYCRRYVRRAYPHAYWGPGWGYGPGFSLYFGGGGHRGWHGGHRHHGGGRHHR